MSKSDASEKRDILDNIGVIFISHKELGTEGLARVSGLLESRVNECVKGEVGYVRLFTCNRIELYYDKNIFKKYDCIVRSFQESGLKPVVLSGTDAARRLMRIASGLESKILGEPEILGQVRQAWVTHREKGVTSKWLDAVFHAAILAGKRVRRETCIGRGSVGYPAVAVNLAARALRGLDGRTVAVLGTGDAAKKIIRILCSSWSPSVIHVISSSAERARSVASGCECCEWLGLGDGFDRPINVDVLFAATTSRYDKNLLLKIFNTNLVVDISIPPIFSKKENIITYKEIEKIAAVSLSARKACVGEAEAIVEDELRKLLLKIAERDVSRAITYLGVYARRVIQEQSDAASRRLGVNKHKIEFFIERSVRKALHPVLIALREASRRGDPSAIVDVLEELLSEGGIS